MVSKKHSTYHAPNLTFPNLFFQSSPSSNYNLPVAQAEALAVILYFVSPTSIPSTNPVIFLFRGHLFVDYLNHTFILALAKILA